LPPLAPSLIGGGMVGELEVVASPGDGGVWLRSAIGAARGAGLLGRQLKQAVYMAMAVDRQHAAVRPSGLCSPLADVEQVLAVAAEWAGRPHSVGSLVRVLRQHGLPQLASRLQRWSRVRNAVAHPDERLVGDIADALRGCSPFLVSAVGCVVSGEAAASIVGGSSADDADVSERGDDNGEVGVQGVQQFFIGDFALLDTGTQTDCSMANTAILAYDEVCDFADRVRMQELACGSSPVSRVVFACEAAASSAEAAASSEVQEEYALDDGEELFINAADASGQAGEALCEEAAAVAQHAFAAKVESECVHYQVDGEYNEKFCKSPEFKENLPVENLKVKSVDGLALGRFRQGSHGVHSRTVGRLAGRLAVLVVGMLAACSGTVGVVLRGEPYDIGGCSRHLGCEVPMPMWHYDDEEDDGDGDYDDYEVCGLDDQDGDCIVVDGDFAFMAEFFELDD